MDREAIKSVKGTVDSAVEKGFVDSTFESVFSVDKRGLEIKDKLKMNLVKFILNKNELFRNLEAIAQEIPEPPKGKLDEWELKGVRERLTTIPYKYDYDQLYNNNQIDERKSKYNKKLNEYIDVSVDCVLLKTIIDNIDENKTYKLNIQNATKLGF